MIAIHVETFGTTLVRVPSQAVSRNLSELACSRTRERMHGGLCVGLVRSRCYIISAKRCC